MNHSPTRSQIKWDLRFLEQARSIAQWSKDPSTKVGAVAIGRHRQRLSEGYNGFPRGIDDSPERLNDRETKYRYTIHAEMNCIFNACLTGVSLEGSTLYVVGLPVCGLCALGVIQSGIKRVVMLDEGFSDRWRDSCEDALCKFREAGVDFDFMNFYEDTRR